MTEDDLAFTSVRVLSKLIRRREVSPTELTGTFLERLERLGPELNAVVTVTRELAHEQARAAESALTSERSPGPLLGIPYGAKDLLATQGIPTTWGAAPLRDQVFDYDATVIRKLRDAGAVLAAKLAMVEIAGGMGYDQPNAAFTGPGKTPWNLDAWSGGSSSGSGSAVAAGLVPYAIGSETWGSITTPAAFCGITGLRPTYGLVSRRGAMALSWTMDKLGPMCRTADDCGLVLEAIAGFDPEDTGSVRQSYIHEGRGRKERFRFGLIRGATDGAEPEVGANFEASLRVLEQFGSIEEVAVPDLPYNEVAGTIIVTEASSAFEDFVESGQVGELTAPEDRIGLLPAMFIPARDYLRALRIRRHISRAMYELTRDYDALISPTLSSVAPPLAMSFGKSLNRPGPPIGAAGNLAGLPAISVPNGFGERGLPTALQLVGRAYDESTILDAATMFQERTDWHTRRPRMATREGAIS